jgi:hypothetical protein
MSKLSGYRCDGPGCTETKPESFFSPASWYTVYHETKPFHFCSPEHLASWLNQPFTQRKTPWLRKLLGI